MLKIIQRVKKFQTVKKWKKLNWIKQFSKDQNLIWFHENGLPQRFSSNQTVALNAEEIVRQRPHAAIRYRSGGTFYRNVPSLEEVEHRRSSLAIREASAPQQNGARFQKQHGWILLLHMPAVNSVKMRGVVTGLKIPKHRPKNKQFKYLNLLKL